MPSYNAATQASNVYAFQTQPEQYRIEHLQTLAEHHVWQLMYLSTRFGKESKRFTVDQLLAMSSGKKMILGHNGIRSRNTIRNALAGLVRKQHLTILDRKGYRHHGTLYRVQMPHEILALQRDPEYVAEQERLALAELEAKRTPKPKQLKLDLRTDDLPAMDDPPAMPPPVAESLAEPVGIPEIDLTEGPETTDSTDEQKSKFDLTCDQKLTAQKARILFMVLNYVINHEKHGGDSEYSTRAHMREGEPGETTTPSPAAPPEPPKPSVVPRPVNPAAKKAEADKRHCNSKATVAPENTDLGKTLMVMLNWVDIVLDQRLKAELRRGYAYFTACGATPEEILRYKVWWWNSGRIRPPKLDWMIENFPVFRGEIAAQMATGTAARPATPGNHSSLIKLPTKASYATIAAQMAQTYTGKHWESISEQMAVFKAYVLRAGFAWNDDLANEVFS
jgi:hypothetical protein